MRQVLNDEALDVVLQAVAKSTPFHMVRLGDGEALALQSVGIDNPEELPNKVWTNHNGILPSNDQKKILVDSLMDVLRKADIVGIHRGTIHKCGKQSPWTRELVNDLNPNALESKADIHRMWLEDGSLDKICSKLKRVLLITGHSIDRAFLDRYTNVTQLDLIRIPLECKYFANRHEAHFPVVWNKVLKTIRSRNLDGTVCLYGGGFIGKSYGQAVKQQGGIAIDIGSVLDLWAGKQTRGSNKGPCSTWKL